MACGGLPLSAEILGPIDAAKEALVERVAAVMNGYRGRLDEWPESVAEAVVDRFPALGAIREEVGKVAFLWAVFQARARARKRR